MRRKEIFNRFAHRVALGPCIITVASSLALAAFIMPAFVAKDAVMTTYSTFIMMDLCDANDTLSFSTAESSYRGLFGSDKDMKLANMLCDSYEVNKDDLVYTLELYKGVEFHDGTTFDASAARANPDRVADPANKPKHFMLLNRVAKAEVADPYTVRATPKEPFSPFTNVLAHPSVTMISPIALKKYGKNIAFHPVGAELFGFVEWRQTDYLKDKKFDGYRRYGLPKIDTIIRKPVVNSNAHATIIQTGGAGFAFTTPSEQVTILESNPKVDLTTAPPIIQHYVSFNTNVKPFDDPKVRQAIDYAVNKDALTKVAFAGYAVPSEGVVPPGIDYVAKLGPWPYNPTRTKELPEEADYPNGFKTQLWSVYNHTTAQKIIQFARQQLAQVDIKASVLALETDQHVRRVESVPKPKDAGIRIYYAGWSSLMGKSDWASRSLLVSEAMLPKSFNTVYYRNEQVGADIANALCTTDRVERSELYTDTQKRIWEDAPWTFLVTEKIVHTHSKRLSGAYVASDGLLSFKSASIKQ